MSTVDTDRVADLIGPERMEGSQARHWHVLGRLEKTAIGTRRAGGEITVRRREPAGCLLYGPYWQLPGGIYRLTFRCRSGRPRMASEPVLGVEVIAMNRVQLAWLDLTAEELGAETGALEFSVPQALGLGAGDEARLEFRFFHLRNAGLTISAVELRDLKTAETRAAPRRWRMLGRLETTLIGRRHTAGVAVRQAARPGCLLAGGRVLLQLPRGHYRLSFGCTAGTPKMPLQPVLGVEILARRRWQDERLWVSRLLRGPTDRGGLQLGWADFTKQELHAGSGSIDFEVPPELGLEGAEEVVLSFRFVHFGNAGLTVRTVELRQVAAETTKPRPLREWRLLGRLRKGRIGARQGDCVVVRHAEPVNTLLWGVRPDLSLPAGRYRLSFCCRTSAGRRGSEPVLAVEINCGRPLSARQRLKAWRSLFEPRRTVVERGDFTTDELAGGSAAVDFEVAAELSREAGQGVNFDFKFVHLGNADLTIGAVNLHEVIAKDVPGNTCRSLTRPNRAKVLIVGNCQAQTLHEALARSSELNSRLDARYHFVALQQDLHEPGRAELEGCDILLVQDIRDWENYPLRPYVRENVRLIKFPLLHFASLWPFDHYNGPGDKEAYEREWPNLTFLYHDGLLARLRKEIPDREQRLRAYRTLSVDGILNYVRLHDFEKRRLMAMDQQFAFNIGRYILDNFQRRRLFYTTNHPNGRVIGMLMQYLLRHIGI
ncbi:MAG: WcbI family polysaccharide biosynthesis putative acetyltransferase, partial [Stellaceae bacterium]